MQLGEVEYLVLDEADQMLAVGFEEDVEVILERLPKKTEHAFICNYAWLGEKIVKKALIPYCFISQSIDHLTLH